MVAGDLKKQSTTIRQVTEQSQPAKLIVVKPDKVVDAQHKAVQAGWITPAGKAVTEHVCLPREHTKQK